MRVSVIVIAVACGSKQPPLPPPPPVVAIDAAIATSAPDAAAPIVDVKRSARARIEAPHGGTIATLAVTPDGGAAISADDLGGIRLWPALDGTVEPRVVDMPRPERFAIGREPRGFVIASIDEVGGLVLQVVDRDGLTLQRVSLGIDPAYVGVAMTDRGALAWRADQQVELLAADGGTIARLPVEAGQRLAGLAVAGSRAVAVIDNGTWRRARWLVVGGSLAWGGWLATGDSVGADVAVSPTGKRLAYVTALPAKPGAITVVETATGAVLANDLVSGAIAVGLPDDDHLAIATSGAVTWVDLTAPRAKRTITGAPVERSPLGIGGGRAVSSTSGELVLATPTQTEFLGYELQAPAVATPAPSGRLLIGLGDSFALLDAQLREQPAPDFAIPSGSAIADLRWLAGDDWLVETSRVTDSATAIALVDVAKRTSLPVRSNLTMVHVLMYEPSTHLVGLSLGEQPEVLRHEPGKLKLDRVATLPRAAGFERAELVPVAPRLAGGTQVVVVHMRDRLTLRWVRDPRALDQGTAVTIDGSPAGVAANGTVFVWQNDPQRTLELAMYRDGKRIGALATEGPTAIAPDATGDQVIVVARRSVALVGLDGTRKWATALQGVTEALWLDDGALAITSAAGIARLDAKTGAVTAARCGWKFGLASKQHPVSPRIEPVCAQLH